LQRASLAEALEKALEIDPDFAPAHATLGSLVKATDNDLAAAAQHLERALALDPSNLDIVGVAAGLLAGLGRLDASLALQEYLVSRDPVNPRIHAGLGLSYLFAGRLDEAIASYGTALLLSPGRICAHFHIGVALLFKSETQAASRKCSRSLTRLAACSVW
jgi:tetratricopeptide (TPR) repeat protein